MITFVTDRNPAKAASLAWLNRHLDYLSDTNHPDHGDIEILSPKIYNTANHTREEFITEVVQADQAYLHFRSRKRGKRTSRIWDETIYRTPDRTALEEGERKMVELTILSLRPGTPTFLQWHFNKTRESWDLHAITPAKSTDWPPRVTLSADFGGGKKHLYAELERLDDELAERLNASRPPQKRITSAKKRRKEKAAKAVGKAPSLAALINKANPKGMITAETIAVAIKATGADVTKITPSSVSVLFPGRKQPRRYDIDSLIEDVNHDNHDCGSARTMPLHEPGDIA